MSQKTHFTSSDANQAGAYKSPEAWGDFISKMTLPPSPVAVKIARAKFKKLQEQGVC